MLTAEAGFSLLSPMSSVFIGQLFWALKSCFHISSCVVPKKRFKVRGSSALNSHIGEARSWQGRTRQKSITWIMFVRPVFLPNTFEMHLCSIITFGWDPQSRPLAVHEVSLVGGLDLKSGMAAQLASRGSVM